MHAETIHGRFWSWFKDQIWQDARKAVAVCEFDCRRQQCTEKEWATCERRINEENCGLSPVPQLAAKQAQEQDHVALPPQSSETESVDNRRKPPPAA
jgi:hypothetical protein